MQLLNVRRNARDCNDPAISPVHDGAVGRTSPAPVPVGMIERVAANGGPTQLRSVSTGAIGSGDVLFLLTS